MADTPALFRRFPGLRGRLPWMPLADALPTAVEPLDRLGAAIGLGTGRLFVKRDDLASTRYGGNKVRKLEHLLADALARGRRAVVTLGAIGSHHALATAIFGREAGLRVHLALYPQPPTPHVLEVLKLDARSGADLVRAGSIAAVPLAVARAAARALGREAQPPYYVPAGGSGALGTLGFVSAALELCEQVRAGVAPPPELVYVAAGTCGTLAGLVLGLKLAALDDPGLFGRTRVVGVRVVPRAITNRRRTLALARRALRLLREAAPGEVPALALFPRDFELLHDHCGPGYGIETAPAREAARRAADRAGLELDPTYTAKAFAGLEAHVRGPARGRGTHLFWHTLNGRDLSRLAAEVDPRRDLPPAFHRYFVGGT